MGMFSDLRKERGGRPEAPFFEIWLEAAALWCFVTLCLIFVTVGGVMNGIGWLLTLPMRGKPKP